MTTTYLQGIYRVPSPFSVLFRQFPSTYYYVSFLAGEEYSLQQLCTKFSVDTVDSSFGVQNQGDFTAKVRVDTPGGVNYSITWSDIGDGSSLAAFMGNPTDIVNRNSATLWDLAHKAGYYPLVAAQTWLETGRSAEFSEIDILSGGAQTQHSAEALSGDSVSMSLRLWATGADAFEKGVGGWGQFLDDLHTLCAGQKFVVTHAGVPVTVTWPGSEVRSSASPVTETGDGGQIWEIQVPSLEVVS